MGVLGLRTAILGMLLLYIVPGKHTGLGRVAFVAKTIIWEAHFRQLLLSVASSTDQVLRACALCPGLSIREAIVGAAHA